jgi:hypothetical protein
MFTQRDPFDGGYGDVRDTGVQLRGTQGQFDFRLGVFNGFGDRQNTLAVSDAKAVLGMLTFRPKAIQGLQVGVSGGTGNTGFVKRVHCCRVHVLIATSSTPLRCITVTS